MRKETKESARSRVAAWRAAKKALGPQTARRPSAGPMEDRRTRRARTRTAQEAAAVEEQLPQPARALPEPARALPEPDREAPTQETPVPRRRGKAPAGPAPLLYPEDPIEDGALRGADGRPIRRGDVVRRPPRYSASLGTTVPTAVGRVKDIVRRNGRDVVYVRLPGESGTAAFDPAVVRRSSAKC